MVVVTAWPNGRGERHPAGNQPRPAKLGQQPEASLTWLRVTVVTERRQRVRRPCDRAPKVVVVGADVVVAAEGSTEASRWPGAEVPPGSKSRACAQWGSPGTWESLPSPRGDRHG